MSLGTREANVEVLVLKKVMSFHKIVHIPEFCFSHLSEVPFFLTKVSVLDSSSLNYTKKAKGGVFIPHL